MTSTQPALSSAVAERARKAHSLALQRLASVGQIRVAEQLGMTETMVSRCVNTDLERAIQVLIAAGLKIVPLELRCYPEAKINALFVLAKGSLEDMESAEKLSFED